ncbi:MAG TPA: glycosyltransferase family 9 protein [Ignavibacteria bacterium]|nr:glycosyltransferase family 9 protein [Ignavibacteria bacterium]
MKILINALSGNGDALMFSPLLPLIKSKLSDSHNEVKIDMLVMFKSVKDMYHNNPYLNHIYHIDFLKQPKSKSLSEIFSLRKNNYDVSINVYPSNRTEYNVLNFLLGAQEKLGHNYVHTKPFRLEFLNNKSVKEIPNLHNVLQNANLIKKIVRFDDEDVKGLEIFLSENDKKNSEIWLNKINPENKIIIGFHAGSSTMKNHIHKRWDKDKFAQLGNLLINNDNALILLFGNEFDLNNKINDSLEGKGIIASTDNYMDSMARLSLCNYFISNDTAFLHSAAAFKIPTVAIFAYTNYKELYPWQNKYELVRKELSCSPCFYNSPKPVNCIYTGTSDAYKCMHQIEVDEVYSAFKKLISA